MTQIQLRTTPAQRNGPQVKWLFEYNSRLKITAKPFLCWLSPTAFVSKIGYFCIIDAKTKFASTLFPITRIELDVNHFKDPANRI